MVSGNVPAGQTGTCCVVVVKVDGPGIPGTILGVPLVNVVVLGPGLVEGPGRRLLLRFSRFRGISSISGPSISPSMSSFLLPLPRVLRLPPGVLAVLRVPGRVDARMVPGSILGCPGGPGISS